MAERWLRGPMTSDTTINGLGEGCVIIYYYLRYLLGYTVVDEVTNSGTFHCHTASGSDGVLSNSSYTFTSSSASFVSGDIGHFLVLVDSSSDKNCGIYEITSYTDANTVGIDFYTQAGNYPDTGTGISWYLFSSDDVPATAGDYFIIESPHATNKFTLKCTTQSGTNAYTRGMSLDLASSSSSESWDAAGHDWKATAKRIMTQYFWVHSYNSYIPGKIFGYGNTDGSIVFLWGFFPLTLITQATFIAVVDAFETDLEDYEKICIFGKSSSLIASNVQQTRQVSTWMLGSGTAYRLIPHNNNNVSVEMVGFNRQGPSTTDLFREVVLPNSRTGKRDALPIWTWMDETNTYFTFGPYGSLPTGIKFATVNSMGMNQTFDSNEQFHLFNGVCINWPGVPFSQ